MEKVVFKLSEFHLKPRFVKLQPNIPISATNQQNITQKLKSEIPQIQKMQFNENQLNIRIKPFRHWDSIRDKVLNIVNKELDEDFIESVEELKNKLQNCKTDELGQINMVIRSAINPVLAEDGGSCSFEKFITNENSCGVAMRFQGACGSCPSSKQTLKNFIEKVVCELLPQFSFVQDINDLETKE